ncbi:SOS response-associated peptidase [Bauldia sp.]|uniref:SOS response-associated peptidase n=1 Tax=Bauldia sp. TaxID=2575872 RepID=UPI003BA9A51A
MCGRFLLIATPDEVAALLGYLDGEWFPPRYNIAPTQPIAIVRRVNGARRFALVRWGLVPGWVEDPRRFSLLINARAEGIGEKPAFKGAFRHRRCLIPASGFYEWRGSKGSARQPHLLRRTDQAPFAFAGLWESWLGRDGSEIDSATIITVAARGEPARIHDRMPLILGPESYDTWLGGDDHRPPDLHPLIEAAPIGSLESFAVGTRVNSVDNDGPDLIEPPAPTLF